MSAQTLQPGDIAIMGWNASNATCDAATTDILSIVFLVDVSPSTTFMITDNGFNRGCNNNWGNTEGVLVFVTPNSTTIPAGTVMHFAINSSGVGSVYTTAPYSSPYSTGWTITKKSGVTGTFALAAGTSCASNQGDQVYIFKDSLWTNNTATPNGATTGTNPIYAFNCKTAWNACSNNTNNSALHSADTCYSFTANTALCPTASLIHYTGPTTTASPLTWWLRIKDANNWTGYSNCTNYNSSSPFIPSSISISGTDTASIACSANCTSCGSTTATLVFTLPAGFTFDVTYTDGTTSYTANGLTNGSTVNQVVTSTKTYTISSVKISGTSCAVSMTTLSTATITITTAPTVNAGPDLTVCSGNNASLSGTRGGSSTSASWSTSGTGTFSNTNILNPQYTPSAADIAAGSVTLTLTTDDPDGAGICNAATDQMTLTISSPTTPTATGGLICGSGSVTLTASGCSGGTIRWYDASTGGTLLASGASYSVSPAATTGYYVECFQSGCSSPRTQVFAVVNSIPATPTLTASMNPICVGQSVTFTASGGTGMYQFFLNGVSLGASSATNTYTSSTLTNGDVVSVKCTPQNLYDGLITSAEGWGSAYSSSSGGATPSFGSGHEINAIYVTGTTDSIKIALAGNVQNNNRILIFIDSKSGGYSTGNFGRAGAINGLDNYNSTNQFDSGFLPDYCLTLGTNAAHNDFFVDLYTLSGTAGSGGGPNYYVGNDQTTANPIGVITSSNNTDYTHGFEVGFLKTDIGYTGGGIKVMAMYIGNSGFLSNQFLTPANSGEGSYGGGTVFFGSAAPNPISIPAEALTNTCISAAASVTITVNPNPTITLGTVGNICAGATSFQIPYTGTTGTPNQFTLIAGAPAMPGFTPVSNGTLTASPLTVTIPGGVAAGTYQFIISVKNSTTGCVSGTQTFNLIINAGPTVSAGTYGPLCLNGTPISLTGSPTGGTFSGTGVTGNTFDPSVGTQLITYTYSDMSGCSNSSSTTITVNAVPGIGITNNTGTTVLTCTTTSISVTATGGVSYSWSGGLGNAAGATITSAGTYTVTVTGSNGCTGSASITITSNVSNPTAGITNNTGTTVLTCTTTSISVTATGGTTYSWSGGLGTSAGASITAAGTYTVTVTAANGCTDTATISVTSNTTDPTAGITNNTGTTILTCAVTTISLTATGGSSYAWSGGLGSTAAANVTIAGTYTVTVTASNGCTDTASITVSSNTTPPTAGITNNSGTTILTCSITTISVTATGGTTYAWSSGLGNSAGASITGAGTYTVTVTGSNGCTSSASIAITSNTTDPTAGITNNTGTTVLTCTTTTISVTATGGISYIWSGSLGSSAGASITSAGTYTVTATGSNGCTDTASIAITNNATAPNANITNNTGTTILTCTTTSISVTATGGTSYVWSGGLGSSATVSITSAGTYTVTATGSNGCTDTANITITSNTTPPTAGITNSSGTTVLTCTTTSISVTATGGTTYSWSGGLGNAAGASITSAGTYTVTATGSNGCTDTSSIVITNNTTPPTAGITNNTGTTIRTCTLTTISVTATGGGAYLWSGGLGAVANASITSAGTYTVTVTAANGCTATSSITITDNTTPPTAGITNNTGTSTISCIITSISLTATGGGTYHWSGGLGNSANANVSGDGTYTVTVTGTNGCTSTASITIGDNIDPPSASITNSSGSTILTCTLTTINVTAHGGTSYSWSGGLGTSANASITTAGTYTVTVTGSNGCTATKSITITSNAAPPTAGITNNTGTTILSCTTTTISVTATGGTSYSWSSGLGATANASISSSGTFTVTVTGSNGCTATSSITVTNNTTPPTAGITNNSGTTIITCNTTSISVTATGGTAYLWSGSLGAAAPAIINSAGTYTVTVTGSNGCTNTTSIVITSNTTPPAVNAGTYGPLCSDAAPITLSGTPSGGTFSGVGVTGNTFDPSVGTQVITYSYTNAVGCSNTATTTITVNTLPGAPDAEGDSICISGVANLTATGCTGALQWYNSPSGGALLGTGSPFTPTVSSTTTYYVQCSNAGCIGSRTAATVTVFPALPVPGLSANPSTQVCSGQLVTYSANASPSGPYLYEFFVNGVSQGSPTTTTTFSYIPNNADQITVKIYYNF